MADQAGSTAQFNEAAASSTASADNGKGKGKAPASDKMDVSMGEEDDSSEGESETEEPVSPPTPDGLPMRCALTFASSRLAKVLLALLPHPPPGRNCREHS
jgi:hypothetical protein